MTLRVQISPETEARLQERAAAVGQDLATYAAGVLERSALRALSVKEISGPVGDAFKQSGMTEDELSEFLEREKHAMRAERRQQP
jgi:hypothetical protein